MDCFAAGTAGLVLIRQQLLLPNNGLLGASRPSIATGHVSKRATAVNAVALWEGINRSGLAPAVVLVQHHLAGEHGRAYHHAQGVDAGGQPGYGQGLLAAAGRHGQRPHRLANAVEQGGVAAGA